MRFIGSILLRSMSISMALDGLGTLDNLLLKVDYYLLYILLIIKILLHIYNTIVGHSVSLKNSYTSQGLR